MDEEEGEWERSPGDSLGVGVGELERHELEGDRSGGCGLVSCSHADGVKG